MAAESRRDFGAALVSAAAVAGVGVQQAEVSPQEEYAGFASV